jgi:hypothetical protein
MKIQNGMTHVALAIVMLPDLLHRVLTNLRVAFCGPLCASLMVVGSGLPGLLIPDKYSVSQ